MAKADSTRKPRTAQDLTGRVFGMLTVIERCDQPAGQTRPRPFWLCQCSCGNQIAADHWNLLRGNTASCACVRGEHHGKTKSPEYRVWQGMNRRCSDEHDTSFLNYGGRGIRVCDRWRESFSSFLANMGQRPTQKRTLDRRDNDGDYCPENCRWATQTQQARNTRANRRITHDGKTLCLAEWQEVTGIFIGVLWARLNLGWDAAKTLTTPVRAMSPRRSSLSADRGE